MAMTVTSNDNGDIIVTDDAKHSITYSLQSLQSSSSTINPNAITGGSKMSAEEETSFVSGSHAEAVEYAMVAGLMKR